MNIKVHVSGSVLSEQSLVDIVREEVRRYRARAIPAKAERIRCAAVKKSGEQCRFYALADTKLCQCHTPK